MFSVLHCGVEPLRGRVSGTQLSQMLTRRKAHLVGFLEKEILSLNQLVQRHFREATHANTFRIREENLESNILEALKMFQQVVPCHEQIAHSNTKETFLTQWKGGLSTWQFQPAGTPLWGGDPRAAGLPDPRNILEFPHLESQMFPLGKIEVLSPVEM